MSTHVRACRLLGICPKLTLRYDPFWKMRAGEASNPGLSGSRKTMRVRKEKKEETQKADELNIEGMLRPMIVRL